MLITAHAPGSAGVGGIFLGDLCLLYPKGSICCFAVTELEFRNITPSLSWLPITYADPPRQRGIRRLGAHVDRLTSPFVLQFMRMNRIPVLVDQAVQFGLQHHIEVVWGVLDHPVLFYMTQRVASRLKARLVTTVYDPPEYLMRNWKYDRVSFQAGMRAFERLLQASDKRGVASAGMQEEYQKRYNVTSLVMIHSPSANLRKQPTFRLKDEGRVVIGFAGALYAGQTWEALLAALSSVNWRLGDREVTIRFMASGLNVQAQGKMQIEYLGWRTVEETVHALSQCDIAYLPYWFDKQYSLSTQLCFPNKLSVYLAAGLAIFYHGPADTSPAKFLASFPAGVSCHSCAGEEIIDSLMRLVSDPVRFADAVHMGQAALEHELSMENFRQRFAELLGVHLDELLRQA